MVNVKFLFYCNPIKIKTTLSIVGSKTWKKFW